MKQNSRAGESDRETATGRFRKGAHWRPHAIFRERAYLTAEYVKKSRSTGDIAREHGVTDAAVLFWLRKHGIPRRSISDARKAKHWGVSGAANPMHGRCGSKNPRWIDGSSPERQRMYARSFWKELVLTVYRRDGFKCLRCASPHGKGNRLHTHHVKPWAGNPDARFDLRNIVTLCDRCHRWVHSKRNVHNEYLSR